MLHTVDLPRPFSGAILLQDAYQNHPKPLANVLTMQEFLRILVLILGRAKEQTIALH